MAVGGAENNSNYILTQWVNEHTDALFSYALKRINDVQVAEDLVQTTFLAAHQSFDKFQHKSSPKTWLFSILKNKILDYLRQVYRNKETFSEQDSTDWFDEKGHWKSEFAPQPWETDNLLDDLEFRKTFAFCIENLPERWKQSVMIKYLESEITIEEIGLSKANYWKMLERARTQLRDCLTKNWFERV